MTKFDNPAREKLAADLDDAFNVHFVTPIKALWLSRDLPPQIAVQMLKALTAIIHSITNVFMQLGGKEL